jgi:PAS domain S-box-containing protein
MRFATFAWNRDFFGYCRATLSGCARSIRAFFHECTGAHVLINTDDLLSGKYGKSRHFVRFYDNDDMLLDEVAAFVGQALRAQGRGLVIASAAHCDALRLRLDAPGQITWLDAETTLAAVMVDGWPDRQRFDAVVGSAVAAAGAGGGEVHAYGDMVALLCARGQTEAALQLERLWNELAERVAFSLFCAYPWDAFPSAEVADAFRQVCAEHQHACAHAAMALPSGGDADINRIKLEQKVHALQAEVARRKQAEEALRLSEREFTDFVENAAEGLHRVGADGTILWANRAELQMLGYRWEEYVGRHIAEFHVDAPVIEEILCRLGGGDTLYDHPARLRCKDGSIKHVLIHSNGYFVDGQLRYTRCFTRDATEQVHSRQEIERAHAERAGLLAELTAASQAKDEFLAMLGHELRNPLSPIVTSLQLMRLKGDEAFLREREVIERQVGHLVRLVDDLMDISRVTRGKIDLKFERVDIAQPLEKAVEMASLLLEQRHHRLVVEVEPGLAWEGDPVRLAQVVANLLTNAARYTEPGGHVRLRAGREGASMLRISVLDDGVGMAPELRAQVFDLFFQGKRNIDRAEGGLGIGLALVKNIVELHGGRVEARSAGKGRGSEFVVLLPLRTPGMIGEEAAAPAATAAQAPLASPRRIMLVDDNVDGAETLARLLGAHGHEVRVFHEPVAALAAVAEFRPDLAVLDIGLPVLDGYELARRMRPLLDGHPCRLVALTGYGQEADKARSEQAGFECHLVKPVNPGLVLRLAASGPGQPGASPG